MALMEKIDKIGLENNFENKYDLGYKNLDSLIGGLKEGSIVTIGARSGVGKTAFMHNILINLLEKYNLPTLYLSLEISKYLSKLRLANIISKESFVRIKDDKDLINKIMSGIDKKDYNLFISDDCSNISELEQLLEENKDIKIVAIDYIQLMKSEKPFTSITDLSNDVLDRLRRLATTKKVIIFILSQLSRNVEYREGKRPLLVDFKNTGNLECNSDVVITMYRESYYNSEIKDNKVEITVSKNRLGSVGLTYFEFNKDSLVFNEY